MKRAQELTINQTQKLALTPDMRQSLAILQMPLMELETYISQQILENCMLEQEDEEYSADGSNEPLSMDSLETGKTAEKVNGAETGFSFDQDEPGEMYRPNNSDLQFKTYEVPSPSAPTLQEHLLFQLHITDLSPQENLIAEFLIGNIDQDGYLRYDPNDTAEVLRVSPEVAGHLLELIQTFDPTGVGARSIEECLLIQLRSTGELPAKESPHPEALIALAKVIIADHLSDIAGGKLAKIAAQLKASLSEVQAAVDLIRALDPKPGRNFGGNHDTPLVIPDVTVRKIDHEYTITVNEPANVRLSLNSFYRHVTQHKELVDAEALKFIKDKQTAALQLMKSIEQRKLTIYRITESIIDIQKDFLEKGILYLKPLTLRQIAEATGVHESTVSRAIAEKYIDTPRGIHPFKFFFSAGLDSGEVSQVSAGSVKKLIQTLIDGENPQSPLSDQQLTELLKNKGVTISRRTVAKYREEMGIFSSDKRRRY